MGAISEQAAALRHEWATDPRWAGVRRDYTAEEVIRLRGSAGEAHTAARRGASRLWELLGAAGAVRAFGAVSGHQAVRQATAGLQAVYLSGRHLAAASRHCRAPIVAEAEGGCGTGPDAFALMKTMTEAGAAGVSFEDQVPPAERGRLGEKVLVPTGQQVEALTAARLAADVLGVRSLIIARTHAQDAPLLASDADERDHEFLTGERTAEGFYRVAPGRYARVTRALAFAPYADLLWLETSVPNITEARTFATIIHSQYPDQLLAYSCAPSFDWQARLGDAATASFQAELAALGYRFQLTTEAGGSALDETLPEARPRVLA